MTAKVFPAKIQNELELRVTYAGEPGELALILKLLRSAGGKLQAHLTYRLVDTAAAFLLCEHPCEAALAFKDHGFEVKTETVVTVRTHDRPGLLSHLTETLEAEQVDISYSYATTTGDTVLLVLRTNDNPKAEDVLRDYLLPSARI